jgi:hypothetical protein
MTLGGGPILEGRTVEQDEHSADSWSWPQSSSSCWLTPSVARSRSITIGSTARPPASVADAAAKLTILSTIGNTMAKSTLARRMERSACICALPSTTMWLSPARWIISNSVDNTCDSIDASKFLERECEPTKFGPKAGYNTHWLWIRACDKAMC